MARGGIWQSVYDTIRPAFLELGVNGNWQVWIRYCGGEAVSIHMVRKGTVGFFNVKCITYNTLRFVN